MLHCNNRLETAAGGEAAADDTPQGAHMTVHDAVLLPKPATPPPGPTSIRSSTVPRRRARAAPRSRWSARSRRASAASPPSATTSSKSSPSSIPTSRSTSTRSTIRSAPLAYEGVAGTIASRRSRGYLAAARRINERCRRGLAAARIRHLRRPDGEMVCDFVDHIAAPLILTPHTVLTEPSEHQRAILDHLVARASRIMVMSRHSRDLLADTTARRASSCRSSRTARPTGRSAAPSQFKAAAWAWPGKKVLMTFGLLGPGKGLERVIEALPAIVARHPETVYRDRRRHAPEPGGPRGRGLPREAPGPRRASSASPSISCGTTASSTPTSCSTSSRRATSM